jgi:ABC-2 type transport system ATP-binding protein
MLQPPSRGRFDVSQTTARLRTTPSDVLCPPRTRAASIDSHFAPETSWSTRDEPTNDLEPLRRRLVWEVLRHVNHERGTTIIFITHDAIEAQKVIERVGMMREGRLVAVGRPSDLKRAIDRKLRLEIFFAPGAPQACRQS